MPNEKYRYRKEYNYKDTLETYHKLEELTVRLFLLWHFERSEYQSVSTRDPYDFIINKGERRFLVILKYFRNLQVSQNNLRFVYKNLQELAFNDKAKQNNCVRLVVVYGLVSDKSRNDIKRQYKAITLDLSNLLWMAAIDEKIESEIKSLLDFSVVDVVPVAPVGLNLKLILSVNNQGLVEMIEEKKKGREPSGYLYDLCLR